MKVWSVSWHVSSDKHEQRYLGMYLQTIEFTLCCMFLTTGLTAHNWQK